VCSSWYRHLMQKKIIKPNKKVKVLAKFLLQINFSINQSINQSSGDGYQEVAQKRKYTPEEW
jgi:ABC-type sugar transport system ATPase subunit